MKSKKDIIITGMTVVKVLAGIGILSSLCVLIAILLGFVEADLLTWILRLGACVLFLVVILILSKKKSSDDASRH
jgi:maltodextrin utilization protein YvdJ